VNDTDAHLRDGLYSISHIKGIDTQDSRPWLLSHTTTIGFRGIKSELKELLLVISAHHLVYDSYDTHLPMY
jgi:hypothetical protein